MQVLLISESRYAKQWARKHEQDIFSITVVKTIPEARTILKSITMDFIIVDYDLFKQHIRAATSELVDVDFIKSVLTYVRFTRAAYLDSHYAEAIVYGIYGYLLDWPSYPVLDHELQTRGARYIKSAPKHFHMSLNGTLLHIRGRTPIELSATAANVMLIFLSTPDGRVPTSHFEKQLNCSERAVAMQMTRLRKKFQGEELGVTIAYEQGKYVLKCT